MKYQVVRESNLSNLESSIKFFFLSEGWEPQVAYALYRQ
jgi:hypothetical protein